MMMSREKKMMDSNERDTNERARAERNGTLRWTRVRSGTTHQYLQPGCRAGSGSVRFCWLRDCGKQRRKRTGQVTRPWDKWDAETFWSPSRNSTSFPGSLFGHTDFASMVRDPIVTTISQSSRCSMTPPIPKEGAALQFCLFSTGPAEGIPISGALWGTGIAPNWPSIQLVAVAGQPQGALEPSNRVMAPRPLEGQGTTRSRGAAPDDAEGKPYLHTGAKATCQASRSSVLLYLDARLEEAGD